MAGRSSQIRRPVASALTAAPVSPPPLSNSSFAIYLPKFTGTIYELLSAPLSPFEIVLAYVGAATTKSLMLGLLILATAGLFVPLDIAHPVWMLTFLLLTAVAFCLFGFVLGVWANGWEQL